MEKKKYIKEYNMIKRTKPTGIRAERIKDRLIILKQVIAYNDTIPEDQRLSDTQVMDLKIEERGLTMELLGFGRPRYEQINFVGNEAFNLFIDSSSTKN